MPKEPEAPHEGQLHGTTYLVYRYLVKRRSPAGISQVQKDLGLSSSSVSEYHLKKLLELGLIRQRKKGYEVDKVVLRDIVRIRSVSIPIQTSYIAFFVSSLMIMILFFRPAMFNSLYFFALATNCCALAISIYETVKTLKRI